MRAAWLLVVGLGAIGGLGLPAAAQHQDPLSQRHFVYPEPGTRSSDVIGWGTLRVEDFRAEHPPVSVWDHGERLAAVSCVFLGTDGTFPLTVRREQPAAGAARYRVRVPGVRIISRFDRGCSWWNPETPVDRVAYTLEHEQIHFALTELAARRLQTVLAERHELLEATATTASRAQQRIQMQLDIAQRKISEALREEHARFDAETSARYDPIAQDRWRTLSEARLVGRSKLP